MAIGDDTTQLSTKGTALEMLYRTNSQVISHANSKNWSTKAGLFEGRRKAGKYPTPS
jgi:hypothetical protein